MTRAWLFGICALALAAPARASDGVIEINQAVVDASGGFPFVLSTPGSYRLTGSLVTADAAVDAIRISTAPATLDLGGFSITGPIACAGVPTVCPGVQTGAAVRSNFFSVTVRNGTVRGMGNGVVLSAFGSRIEGVHATGNRVTGLEVGAGSLVVGSTAHQNGAFGIAIGPGSVALGNTVASSGADGFDLSAGSVVVGNASSANGDDGYGAEPSDGIALLRNTARSNAGNGFSGLAAGGAHGLVLAGNGAHSNDGSGIVVRDGCVLIENVSRNNDADGISVSDASLLLRNAARLNTGNGLVMGGVGSGFGANVTTGNLDGQITRDGNDLVLEPNLCGGDELCF